MGRIHFLTQFIWPDDAPTGIYAEQVAQALHDESRDVVLVGGQGSYRPETQRPQPTMPCRRVAHYAGPRHSLMARVREYRSVHRAFLDYIRTTVNRGDVVIMTSAPPKSLTLHSVVRRKGAQAIYWMQDYYPELARALFHYPAIFEKLLARRWNRHLKEWDCVVKAAQNLGYDGRNATVIRNWPTLNLGRERPFIKGVVLYAGNLGYAHDLPLLLEQCEKLHAQGKKIIFRADGPKVKQLPAWIQREPLRAGREELMAGFWQAETHLVAADPNYRRAVFPSKYWNCRATGRDIVCTGFAGEMVEELGIAQACDYAQHLKTWVSLVKSLQ